jgi:transposase-like protein
VEVDHSTVNRWVIKYSPQLEETFHRCKRPVWISWHMHETYVKVKGQWHYLYRAVDKQGQTIDFLRTEHCDTEAALRFLKKAIHRHGVPETITIDGSEANAAAIKRYNAEHGTNEAAQDTLVGIELMHMIKKRQLVVEEGDEGLTAAELFYSLAA